MTSTGTSWNLMSCSCKIHDGGAWGKRYEQRLGTSGDTPVSMSWHPKVSYHMHWEALFHFFLFPSNFPQGSWICHARNSKLCQCWMNDDPFVCTVDHEILWSNPPSATNSRSISIRSVPSIYCNVQKKIPLYSIGKLYYIILILLPGRCVYDFSFNHLVISSGELIIEAKQ